MNKFLVLTTIFQPTKALQEFSKYKDYKIVVAGDRKTPKDWHFDNVEFLSIDFQKQMDSQYLKAIPENHYVRKAASYLFAKNNGADVIVETDDDNIPLEGWAFPKFDDIFSLTAKDKGFVNIYKNFTSQMIWPRGLPLNKIHNQVLESEFTKENCKIGQWQGLANLDPDVDAIYRLIFNQPCTFDDREPIVLNDGTFCPLNTQNSATRKELFAILYLPCTVSFRFTDILRGIVAQPVMQALGYKSGFTKATVYQERNDHDFFKDYVSENQMYLTSQKSLDIAISAVKQGASIKDNLFEVYTQLYNNNIVDKKELEYLDLWLKEI